MTDINRRNTSEISELSRAVFENPQVFVDRAESRFRDQLRGMTEKVAASGSHIVLLCGPSSSGKTTFAKRLAIQLRVNGLRPVTLGTDDYFVDREHTPLTSSGEYDFEHLQAVDVPVLNRDLADLDAGREIQRPTFDFHTGSRAYKGKTLRLDDDQVVVLEGIHSLNP